MLGRSIVGAIAAVLAAAVSPLLSARAEGETVRIQDYPGVGNMLFRIAAAKGHASRLPVLLAH